MTIYLGSTQVSNIYKGSESVSAYIGDLIASGGGAEAVFQTLFDHSVVTGMADAGDSSGYTLGTVMTLANDGYIDAVYIWKPSGNTQTIRHVGIYDTSGNLLSRGSFGEMTTAPAGPLWELVSLGTPLEVTADQTVVVAATVSDGYSATAGDFTSAIVRGEITGEASADVSGNGRFNDSSGTTLNYPATTGNGANYNLDIRYYADQTAPSGILSGYPNAANSGHSGTLTAYEGSLTISTEGAVLEDLDITGALDITAANVVIRNCRITYPDGYGVDGEFGPNLTVQDCTFIGPGALGEANAAILGTGTFTGNDISLSENGIVTGAGASVVSDNYIHDLLTGKAEPHYDGISVQGGQDGVLISHNTVIGDDTSDIFLKDDFGPINDITISNNLLLGTPGYMIAIDEVTPGNITNITIEDNKLIRGGFAYYSADIEGVTLSGNVNAYSNLPV